MTGLHNFSWSQGEDLTISLIYKEGPEGEETPVDLAEYELRMDLSSAAGGRLLTLNSYEDEDGEPEVELGTSGQIYIRVPREVTLEGGELYSDIAARKSGVWFEYDIFLRDKSSENFNGGRQFRILKGRITVDRSVTLWK